MVEERMNTILEGITHAYGGSFELKYERGTPATINDPVLSRKMIPTMERVVGKEKLIMMDPVMGGEDFGMYGRDEPKIPSSLFWLGSVKNSTYQESTLKGVALPSLHSDLYLPDASPTIDTGIKAMTQAAYDLLKKKN